MSVSWNPSLPMRRLPIWPVMQTIGDESIIAVAMPVTMLVAPGPEVAMPLPPVRHVRRDLLVPHQDVTDRIAEHRVIRGQNRAARISEHIGHSLAHQRVPDN